MSIVTSAIAAKRLGLMHDLLPTRKAIGFLSNPTFATAEAQLKDTRAAAQLLGPDVAVFIATTEDEIDVAFKAMLQQGIPGLIVAADPFFDTRRGQLIALTARHALPAMYQSREYTRIGGLISYGINLANAYRQVGAYVGRILNGASPAELPVLEASKFELIINRNAAKALGLDLPAVLLAQANEIIE